MHLISSPVVKLPFDLADACQPESLSEESTHNRVLFNNLLDGRVLHLRVRLHVFSPLLELHFIDSLLPRIQTPTNQAIFNIQAAVEDIFCAHLRRNKFLRIHTPKLQGAATESGASVFKLGYFKGSYFSFLFSNHFFLLCAIVAHDFSVCIRCRLSRPEPAAS